MKVKATRLFLCGVAYLYLQAGGQVLAAETPQSELSLVPQPLMLRSREDAFMPGPRLRVAVDPGASAPLLEGTRWLATLVSRQTGRELRVSGQQGSASEIRLTLVDEQAMRARFEAGALKPPGPLAEAYWLSVDSSGVAIQAAGEAGLFYGMASLWQLASSIGDNATQWPGLELLDAPEFAWRGLMLDSARHMQSVAFIKRYLDWMSLHKLNTFHWHLTDDQAWRLEIKRYPRLAEIGGFRVPAGQAAAADIDPATGQPRLYGGFYTQEQVREIVEYAAARFITVVPEIDVPGHATAAIAAYPELGVEGHGVSAVPASWGIFENAFNLEESTFEFLEGVLTEVIALFPGPFVHLGGDEVGTAQWRESPRVATRMRELGIDDMQSVQNYYIERFQKFLEPHGRRVIGWDEILQSDLPADAVVMSWRGIAGALEASSKGHETVLSPSPTFYLDHIQTTAADAPPGRGGIVTVRDIYEFDPLPGELADRRDLVLGLQGNVWTEHIRTEQRVSYMTWPRAAAIAELAWSPATRRDWSDFSGRLPAAVERLRNLGIAVAEDRHALYRMPLPESRVLATRREDRELKLCSEAIVLALEDDAPLQGERESYLVDIQNPCWIWGDAPLTALKAIRASVGQLPFNFEIGEAIHSVIVEEPRSPFGELVVRLGGCDGPVVAEASLKPAVDNPAATVLPPAPVRLPDGAGSRADLCFSFTRSGVEPIWAVDWIELVGEGQ